MMQKEEEEVSSPMMDPWSLFLYRMKAPMTMQKYRGTRAKFFNFIGLTGGTMEEHAKMFAQRGKKEPDWMFVGVLRSHKPRKKGPQMERQVLQLLETTSKQSKAVCYSSESAQS